MSGLYTENRKKCRPGNCIFVIPHPIKQHLEREPDFLEILTVGWSLGPPADFMFIVSQKTDLKRKRGVGNTQ